MQYEISYVVRKGGGIPGREVCTGCGQEFTLGEIFEIGSFYDSENDVFYPVNLHKDNEECRKSAHNKVLK